MMRQERKAGPMELLKGPGVRFGIVGASLTLLDLLLYHVLANVVRVSFFDMPSSICAVWLGTPLVITLNFFISHKFVWRSSTSKRRTFVPFFGLNLTTGMVVQPLVINGVLWFFSTVDYVLVSTDLTNIFAKCIAVGVGMILNFFGAKYLFKYNT